MSEAEKKIYHFNSNIRSNTGSRSSMTNNEERFLRALEIQERKRALLCLLYTSPSPRDS